MKPIIKSGGVRNSNLELLRILTMLIIVAHHYVVNSGLIQMVNESNTLGKNDILLLLFGWGGKTGINCFILITGYFMSKSNITVKKFCKLLGEFLFYNIIFYTVFLISGYNTFSLKGLLETIFPLFNVSTDFTSCFLMFYLFIPFLNKMIRVLTEKEHLLLIALCVFIYTVLPSFINAIVIFNYVTWFIILYLIAGYINLYSKKIFNYTKFWGISTVVTLILSWGSIVVLAYVGRMIGNNGISYFFVADSNKVLALLTSLCAFMLFKNMKLRQSKVINTISASTFGVLLIHANSDAMRKWLWVDTLKNVSYYHSSWLVIHAILSVVGVFTICVLIDQIRIRLIETPLERIIEKL